jgi:hypothetical protein
MQKGRRDFMGFVSGVVAMLSFGSINLGADSRAISLARVDVEADIYDLRYDEFDPDGWL